MTKSFLKYCLKQLNSDNFCYVYTKEQAEEVLKNCNKKVICEPNECGYTIKVVRGEKNE